MAMVKQVVQLKNNVNTLPASEYPSNVKVPLPVTYAEEVNTRGRRCVGFWVNGLSFLSLVLPAGGWNHSPQPD